MIKAGSNVFCGFSFSLDVLVSLRSVSHEDHEGHEEGKESKIVFFPSCSSSARIGTEIVEYPLICHSFQYG